MRIMRPVKKREAERDGSRVKRVQRIVKGKCSLWRNISALRKQRVEQPLEYSVVASIVRSRHC